MTKKEKVTKIINAAGTGIAVVKIAKKSGVSINNLYGIIYAINKDNKGSIICKNGKYYSAAAFKEVFKNDPKKLSSKESIGNLDKSVDSIFDELVEKTTIRKIAGLPESDQENCLIALKNTIFHRLEMRAIITTNEIIKKVIHEMGK